MSRLLTAGEAAEYLRSSAVSLARWRTKGTGPRYSKPAGRVLYDPADLDQWLADKRRHSTADVPTPRRRRGRPRGPRRANGPA